jgi:hypothetical protein
MILIFELKKFIKDYNIIIKSKWIENISFEIFKIFN